MRLFFALWPSEQERAAAVAQMITLKQHIKARWVQPNNLHVTLAFLGEVEKNRLPEVLRAGASCQPQAFEFTLDKLDYWPKPQVLCFTCPNTPQPLAQLASDLANQLVTAGFELESRPYRPHLTLARKALQLPVDAAIATPIPWQANSFVLVESSTSSNGPHYEVLQTWPFAVSLPTSFCQ